MSGRGQNPSLADERKPGLAAPGAQAATAHDRQRWLWSGYALLLLAGAITVVWPELANDDAEAGAPRAPTAPATNRPSTDKKAANGSAQPAPAPATSPPAM